MKERILGAVVIGASILAMGGDADAGVRDNTSNVFISGNNFQGGLGIARNTSNSTEWIGCWTNGNGVASCTAVNSAGTSLSCSTSNSAHLLVLRSLHADSYLSVNVTSGSCSSMTVFNDSRYAGKNHN